MLVSTVKYGPVELIETPPMLPVTEWLEWKTSVVQTHEGGEERAAVRMEPRQTLSFSFLADDTSRFNQAYRSVQSLLWAVPVWVEAQEFSAELGDRYFSLPGWEASDFRSNSLALLVSGDEVELVDLSAAGDGFGWGLEWGLGWDSSPNRLVLSEPLSSPWVGAQVVPVRVGRVTLERRTHGPYDSFSCTFRSNEPGARPGTATDQFEGADIYLDPLLLDGEWLTDEFQSRVDVFDNGTGIVSVYTPWKNNRVTRRLRTVLTGLTEIWSYKSWLHRRQGKFRGFWLSYQTNDLIPVAVAGSSLDVKGEDYDTKRKHIAIAHTGGVLFARINSATDQGGGITRLVLNVTPDFSVAQIQQVSYLGLWRLDADRIEISYSGAGLAESIVPIVEVSP